MKVQIPNRAAVSFLQTSSDLAKLYSALPNHRHCTPKKNITTRLGIKFDKAINGLAIWKTKCIQFAYMYQLMSLLEFLFV